MINCGIIGFGKMGKIRAKAIETEGSGRVVAVFEVDKQIDSQGYRVFSSADDLLASPNIDAVFVCTPNIMNKTYTIAGLKGGKHVFCEKPPAFTAADVEEIREVEASSGKKLMYGFNHRHHRSVETMKNIIDSKKFGRILWMRGRYGKSVDDDFFQNWRSKKDMAGGGILIDQGIHMLDLLLYMGGSFDEIHALVSNLYWEIDVEDNVFAIMRNSKTGTVASLHSTMTQWRHLFSLEIFMENGYMVLNGLKTSSGTYGDEVLSIAQNRTTAPRATWEDEEKITFHVNTSWKSEITHFFSAIKNDSSIKIGNSKDALTLMKLIDRIYQKRGKHE